MAEDIDKEVADIWNYIPKKRDWVGNWRPIDFAPEEQWLLILDATEPTNVPVVAIHLDNDEPAHSPYRGGWWDGENTLGINPTHWMPLPDNPRLT